MVQLIQSGNEVDRIRAINKKKGLTDAIQTPSDSQAGSENSDENPLPKIVSGSDNNVPPIIAKEGEITLSEEHLRGLVQAGVKQEMKTAQQQLDTVSQEMKKQQQEFDEYKKKSDTEKQELEARLDSERKQKESLAKVFGDFGYQIPGTSQESSTYIAPLSMRGGMNPSDAVREFTRILDDNKATPKVVVVSPDTGEESLQQDTRVATRFLRANRTVMRDGMEALLQKAGFLKGQSSYVASDAATTISTIPPAFLTYLSTVLRIEHSAQFVLWQFANYKINATVPPGQTCAVPRVRHLNAGTRSSDWRLTPGQDTTSATQPIQGASISVEIYENGMGKDENIPPVSIPDFIMAYSLIDLESVMSSRMGYNYHLFQDISIQEMWFATTRVVYNNRNSVVESAAGVTAGGGGQLTNDFLGNLRAYLSSTKIPTFPDGKYGYAAPPSHIAQLNADLGKRIMILDKSGAEELTNMLFTTTNNNDLGRISGYAGTLSGFHIFEGNSFSTDVVGTPGVAMETVGGVSTLTRAGFAFGPDSIGWATAMPMEIRPDPNTNFGRNRKFIWKSHEGWAALDVDPASNPPSSNDQQLRVVEVHTPMVPV